MATDIYQFDANLKAAIETNDGMFAQRIVNDIRAELARGGLSDSDRLQLERVQAQFSAIAMRFLTEAQMGDVLENRVSEWLLLPEDVDLIELAKGYLSNIDYVEDRNKQRDLMKAALERSTDRLGSQPLKLGQETVPQTIGNWIKVIISDVGANDVSTVKLARFLAQNPNVQSLTPQEKAAVRRLVYFYEFLKLRSDQIQGFENDVLVEDEKGNTFFISDGKVQPLYDRQTIEDFKDLARHGTLSSGLLVDLIQKFPNDFKEFVNQTKPVITVNPEDVPQRFAAFIEEQRTKFAHRVPASGVPLPNRTAALVAMLHKAMQGGKEADMVLAKEILQFTFADRERLVNFMRHSSVLKFIQDEFPSQIGEKNRELVRQSPVSPMALQALLMIVFSKRFALSDEETAWQSFDVMQKVPATANELRTVVTYNPAENKLVWRYEA
jgi:hypothetical protein